MQKTLLVSICGRFMPETWGRRPEGPRLSLELEWGLGGGGAGCHAGGLQRELATGQGCQCLSPAAEVFVGGDEEKKAVSQQVSIGL